jgi:hypothetical protein
MTVKRAALPIVPVDARVDQLVDGFLVRIARLPRTQVDEPANTSHATTQSTRRARTIQA